MQFEDLKTNLNDINDFDLKNTIKTLQEKDI